MGPLDQKATKLPLSQAAGHLFMYILLITSSASQ